MKIAFISDIHGNAVALEAVLTDLREKDVDEVFVLGDICFRGPEPKRSLEIIQTLNTDVIKGNADEWIVRGIHDGEVPKEAFLMMNKERDWAVSKLADHQLKYLNDLPTELNLEFGDIKIHAFHATPNSLFDIVQPFASDEILEEQLFIKEAKIYIYAHIHKPYIRFLDGKCVINTGSVGLPFDGIARSSYVLLDLMADHVEASIVRITYDVDKVIEQFTQSDYPNKDFMIDVLKKSGL